VLARGLGAGSRRVEIGSEHPDPDRPVVVEVHHLGSADPQFVFDVTDAERHRTGRVVGHFRVGAAVGQRDGSVVGVAGCDRRDGVGDIRRNVRVEGEAGVDEFVHWVVSRELVV